MLCKYCLFMFFLKLFLSVVILIFLLFKGDKIYFYFKRLVIKEVVVLNLKFKILV